jgi:acyl-CoA dehydrogenase
MDFTLSPEVERTRQSIRGFVEDRLIPLERDRANYDEHENVTPKLLQVLRAEVKSMGLWALGMPKARGGRDFSMVGLAPCYEEMNRSIFGPVVFNVAAPDDGNMRVLEQVATEAQKARWLQPVVDGETNSSFAMTEPNGCGSDATMTYTRATRIAGGWRIVGRKHYITGAGIAKHFLLVARTSDDVRRGLSVFLFHADQPGWRIVRRIPIMGPEEHGGHCELEFDGLEIPDENMLMGEGDGLKLTQIRLGPARVTHCMRWLGLARRSLEIALDHVEQRSTFGVRLADRESVQGLLAQAAMDIQTARLLTMYAAWQIDRGVFARKEISMAKVAVAAALNKAADTALQVMGARGYSKDTPVEWIYRYARQARIVDGATEVHQSLLAGALFRERAEFWHWDADPDE